MPPIRFRSEESITRIPIADVKQQLGNYFESGVRRVARGIGSAIDGIVGSEHCKMATNSVASNKLLSNTTIPGFTESQALIDGINITHSEYFDDISCNGSI